MIYIVLSLSVLLVVNFILFELYQKPLYAFMTKGLASFSFILIFVYAVLDQDVPRLTMISLFILLGLVSGLLGDLFLALRTLREKEENYQIINSGILCFSVGHIFYLAALLMLSNIHYLAFIVSFVMTLIVVVGSKVLKFDMKISKYPSYFYSILIFLMIGQALGYYLWFSSTFGLMILIGAILFGISDLILAPIYFKNDQRKFVIVLNLSTYYLAQILIAFSIYFLT